MLRRATLGLLHSARIITSIRLTARPWRTLATRLGVNLVVVGPEAPLVAGVADVVRANGIDCFGPSAAAAQLEGSKAFAKQVMAQRVCQRLVALNA